MANLDLDALVLASLPLMLVFPADSCSFSMEPRCEEFGRIEGLLYISEDLGG